MQLSYKLYREYLLKASLYIVFITMAIILPKQIMADEPTTIGETDITPFAFTGSLSLISEAYAVNGIDARRPPGMGRVQFNSSFTLFGLQSGINLMYSTDDNRLRQSMNQFNFQGSWRWLTFAAGTVIPRFSKYSLGGVSVTGGLIEMNPAWFSLSLTGGRTKRAVEFSDEPGFREPAFERWLYGARMGFGKQGGTQFAISGIYAYDVDGSVNDPGDIMPARNVIITPELNFALFQRKLQLESNISISAFTRNQNATGFNIEEFENIGFLNDILSPNSSTFVDFATEVSARLNLGPVRFNGGYERVQPGFRSLGLGNIRSDLETYRLRTQFRMFNGRANLSGMYSHGRNNLLDTKISTMNRQQLGSTLAVRFSQKFNVNMSYMRLENLNQAVDATSAAAPDLHSKIISQNFMLTPMLILMRDATSHTISLTGGYQLLEDRSEQVLAGERPASDFDNITLGANYGISLPSSLSLNVAGNLMHNNTETSSAIGNAINVSGGYSFLERRLTTSLNLGWSRNGIEFVRIVDDPDYIDPLTMGRQRHAAHSVAYDGNDFLDGDYVVEQWSQQFSVNLSASYRFQNGNPLRLSLRGLVSRPGQEGGREYNEFHAVLRYQHRF